MEELSQYHMVIQHRPGSKHGNADALSTPCSSCLAGFRLENFPFGECYYCRRANQQWGHFTMEAEETDSLTDSSLKTVAKIAEEDPNERGCPRILTRVMGL